MDKETWGFLAGMEDPLLAHTDAAEKCVLNALQEAVATINGKIDALGKSVQSDVNLVAGMNDANARDVKAQRDIRHS